MCAYVCVRVCVCMRECVYACVSMFLHLNALVLMFRAQFQPGDSPLVDQSRMKRGGNASVEDDVAIQQTQASMFPQS